MKKLLKTFISSILPITIFISFIIIGKISEQQIYIREGIHPTMSGAISFIAWTFRGICVMVLIIAYSFVLYSKLSKTVKILVITLILILNMPLMYFLELSFYFRLGLLLIPVANLIAFSPALASILVHNKRIPKEDEHI